MLRGRVCSLTGQFKAVCSPIDRLPALTSSQCDWRGLGLRPGGVRWHEHQLGWLLFIRLDPGQ